MRLLRFGEVGNEKPGVLVNDKILNCSDHFKDWNREFFLNDGLKMLEELISTAASSNNLPQVSPNVRIGSCVPRPNMILCVGLNYSDHAIESGMEIPKEPVLFMKATNTIAGPFDDVPIPQNSSKTDWEVELAIVLKDDLLYPASEEEAAQAIAGYCIMHDVSEREFQLERGGQWVKGKSCPGFSPVGPYLVTPDEIPDVSNLSMKLSVNNKTMQNGSTSTMIFRPDFLLYHISQFMKLEAGDIITTGTPPGVGLGQNPPQYLKRGDRVELSIDHLGAQMQSFV